MAAARGAHPSDPEHRPGQGTRPAIGGSSHGVGGLHLAADREAIASLGAAPMPYVDAFNHFFPSATSPRCWRSPATTRTSASGCVACRVLATSTSASRSWTSSHATTRPVLSLAGPPIELMRGRARAGADRHRRHGRAGRPPWGFAPESEGPGAMFLAGNADTGRCVRGRRGHQGKHHLPARGRSHGRPVRAAAVSADWLTGAFNSAARTG